ncbi:MAG: hypothetical protein WCT36_06150 [Candidatus Gracilibacteria bacterium]|jgi:hypothetical protein
MKNALYSALSFKPSRQVYLEAPRSANEAIDEVTNVSESDSETDVADREIGALDSRLVELNSRESRIMLVRSRDTKSGEAPRAWTREENEAFKAIDVEKDKIKNDTRKSLVVAGQRTFEEHVSPDFKYFTDELSYRAFALIPEMATDTTRTQAEKERPKDNGNGFAHSYMEHIFEGFEENLDLYTSRIEKFPKGSPERAETLAHMEQALSKILDSMKKSDIDVKKAYPKFNYYDKRILRYEALLKKY